MVLDVGTTSIKALVFDADLNVVSKASGDVEKKVSGKIVEQSAEELLAVSAKLIKEVFDSAGLPAESYAGFGITNQRETVIMWNRETGQPVGPAIVWEDERTQEWCAQLNETHGAMARAKTGLPIIPYFSASKISWVLKNNPVATELAQARKLLFGTVDTWLLWNLLEGNPHLTDHTNASRTLLYNIREMAWDKDLMDLFGVKIEMLPIVRPSRGEFGVLKKDILGFSLPVLAIAGDQQASLYAAGSEPGTTKVTFGTGTFMLQKIGAEFQLHDNFFTTLSADEQPDYAVESRIDFYGREVEPLLDKPDELEKLFEELALKVLSSLKTLPTPPRQITIDGGVTRDNRLAGILEKTNGVKVVSHKIFDGTALGIAKMIFRQTSEM